jgi:hypothetical protein
MDRGQQRDLMQELRDLGQLVRKANKELERVADARWVKQPDVVATPKLAPIMMPDEPARCWKASRSKYSPICRRMATTRMKRKRLMPPRPDENGRGRPVRLLFGARTAAGCCLTLARQLGAPTSFEIQPPAGSGQQPHAGGCPGRSGA